MVLITLQPVWSLKSLLFYCFGPLPSLRVEVVVNWHTNQMDWTARFARGVEPGSKLLRRRWRKPMKLHILSWDRAAGGGGGSLSTWERRLPNAQFNGWKELTVWSFISWLDQIGLSSAAPLVGWPIGSWPQFKNMSMKIDDKWVRSVFYWFGPLLILWFGPYSYSFIKT